MASVRPLLVLHEAGYEIAVVVTGEDRRRARRAEPSPSPVKEAALGLGLPVAHDLAAVSESGADLGVVVAYGSLIPADLLAAVPMVNLHFSLLPRWRGAAPVERAILAGDTTTGVCVMAVDVELDTGAIFASIEVPIGADETADFLRDRLVDAGAGLLVETLGAGLGEPTEQEGEPVYAHKIEQADLELDWSGPATDLERIVRVGGAWTTFRGRRLKVWAAWLVDGVDAVPGSLHGDTVAAGEGALRLLEVQPESRGRQPAEAWLMGARTEPGESLG